MAHAATPSARTRPARALYEEALAVGEFGGKGSMTYSLNGLAAVESADGDPQRGAYLLGAAEARRESIALTLEPAEQQEVERTGAAARAALGDEAFETAFAAGRAMSLDEAVEYALSARD